MLTPKEAFDLAPRVVELGKKVAKATHADSDGGKKITRAEMIDLVGDVLALLGALVVGILT